MSELPEGWILTLLSDVAQWGSGGTPSRSNPAYYGGNIPWIKTGELGQGIITDTEEKITELGLQNSSAKIFPKGAVAVAMYGATIGKTAILGIDAATNQACAVGIPTEGVTTTAYLFHYLASQKNAFVEVGKGGAQPNISQTVIKNWSMPLAPLNEQRRIADKLDRLLARVNACRERCDRVPLILKRFRQSVLAFAVSGELTEDWREENPDVESASDLFVRLQEQFRGDFIHRIWRSQEETSSVTLPQSWVDVPIEAVGEVFLGRQRSPKNHSGPNMRPYVRAANITWAGWDFSDVKEMNFDSRDFERYRLQVGDVLINEGSGSADEVGKPAIWRGEIENCCFQNTLICVRPYEDMSEYLHLVFLHAALSKAFVEATRGVNIHHIGKERFAAFLIPLPPLREQQEIIRRANVLFAFADRLEARYKTARAQVDHLTPASLDKAFRGELVPQDPNDEPASVLLERIRNQLATALVITTVNTAERPQRFPVNFAPPTGQAIMLTLEDIQPSHLSSILRKKGSLTAEDLWFASQLEIDDFYGQLKDEEAQGLLRERKGEEPDAPRLLEAA